VAFLWGWAMFWVMHSGIIAASAVILARYAGYFLPLGEWATRAAAVAAILILSAVNYAGVRQASSFQVVVTAIKLAAIALLLVLAAAAVTRGGGFSAPVSAESGSLRGFAVAVGACLFTFGGWHMVTYSAEETRDPARTIPRALIIGTLVVTACYVGINAVCLAVLPYEHVAHSTRAAADVAEALAGARGGAVIAALVLISSLSVLNGVILTGPRVYLAMARDGLLFGWLKRIHPRFHTPYTGIVAQAVWASVLAGTTTYRGLFSRVIYTEWLFFALMTIGLFRLRRGGSYTPAYRVWGYPWAPAIFIAAALLVALYQISEDPAKAAAGLGLVLAGLPIYYLWARRGTPQGTSSHADH
jgi:APA family basic amino acid/polyamine antiporter